MSCKAAPLVDVFEMIEYKLLRSLSSVLLTNNFCIHLKKIQIRGHFGRWKTSQENYSTLHGKEKNGPWIFPERKSFISTKKNTCSTDEPPEWEFSSSIVPKNTKFNQIFSFLNEYADGKLLPTSLLQKAHDQKFTISELQTHIVQNKKKERKRTHQKLNDFQWQTNEKRERTVQISTELGELTGSKEKCLQRERTIICFLLKFSVLSAAIS